MENGRMENALTLHGRVAEQPRVSHQNHGQTFYVFPLAVCRLSGVEDRINVLAPQQMLDLCNVAEGDEVTVEGEVRSFNNRSGQGSRLVITAYARRLVREQTEDENRLNLTGVLCKPPVFRRTPLGRDICDMMLAVNRRYGRADYLPCISWGTLAHRCAALDVGETVRLGGRLQSRTYTKRVGENEELRTAFEVSVMTMEDEE
ncbi:MAG: single-stranded DNA-binding protein [Oscillospiraceae bacterium]|nr:single-stranded DNA-binding protein [Oscillospiraceae bacterium]